MRSRTAATVLATILVVVLFGGAGPARAGPEPYRYELRLGATKYEVAVDQPFEIALPGGGRLDAVLRHALARWSGRGVRFSYPGDMTVEASEFMSKVVFTIARGDSVYVNMLLYPPGATTPKAALAEALKGQKWVMETRHETTVSEAPHTARIAGLAREGVRLTGRDGDDPPGADIFALPFDKRVLVIGFLSPRSSRAAAEVAFSAIAGSLTTAEDVTEEADSPTELVLHIGKRAHAIDPDQAFVIEAPGGRKHTAVLVRGRTVYSRFGIRFSHPGDTVARTEERTGRVTIHVEHGKDYFASLQLFLVGNVSRDDARKLAAKHVRASVERTTEHRFGIEKSCRQMFLGRSREGIRIATVADEDPIVIEIYAFEIDQRVISVLFFCRESNRATARKAFELVASSLRGNR